MSDSPRQPLRGECVWPRVYVVLCAVLFVPAVFFATAKPHGISLDFWQTAATVREISVHLFRPENPILAASEHPAGRFVPYTLFWGVFMRVTGAGIFTTMGLAALANYGLFVYGLYRFISRQFGSRSLPSFVLMALLVAWGKGHRWANAYHLDMFFLGLPYVYHFCYGLTFLALSYLASYCEHGRRRNLVLYAVTSVVCFVTHPVTGAFCYVAAFALLVARGHIRRAVLLQAVPLAAIVVCLVWPYFNYWDSLFGGRSPSRMAGSFARHLTRRPHIGWGPALFGAVVLAYYATKRRHLFVCLGLVLCAAIYAVAALARIPYIVRFVFFTAFFLQLGVALFADRALLSRAAGQRWLGWRRAVAIAVIAGLLVPAVYWRRREVSPYVARMFEDGKLIPYRSPASAMLFVRDYLGPGDAVLMPHHGAWVVPAVSGAKVVESRYAMAFVLQDVFADYRRRRVDVHAFLEEDLTIEERRAICAKYGVTHLLLSERWAGSWHESFKRDLDELAVEEARHGGWVLYGLKELGRVTGTGADPD